MCVSWKHIRGFAGFTKKFRSQKCDVFGADKSSWLLLCFKKDNTVIFTEDEILEYDFDSFTRFFRGVPYLAKSTSAASPRLTMNDEDLEIDLSPVYFNLQMKAMLGKQILTLQALSKQQKRTHFHHPFLPHNLLFLWEKVRASRSLTLRLAQGRLL